MNIIDRIKYRTPKEEVYTVGEAKGIVQSAYAALQKGKIGESELETRLLNAKEGLQRNPKSTASDAKDFNRFIAENSKSLENLKTRELNLTRKRLGDLESRNTALEETEDLVKGFVTSYGDIKDNLATAKESVKDLEKGV